MEESVKTIPHCPATNKLGEDTRTRHCTWSITTWQLLPWTFRHKTITSIVRIWTVISKPYFSAPLHHPESLQHRYFSEESALVVIGKLHVHKVANQVKSMGIWLCFEYKFKYYILCIVSYCVLNFKCSFSDASAHVSYLGWAFQHHPECWQHQYSPEEPALVVSGIALAGNLHVHHI